MAKTSSMGKDEYLSKLQRAAEINFLSETNDALRSKHWQAVKTSYGLSVAAQIARRIKNRSDTYFSVY